MFITFFAFAFLSSSDCSGTATDISSEILHDYEFTESGSACFKTGQGVIIKGSNLNLTLHNSNSITAGPQIGFAVFSDLVNGNILEIYSDSKQKITIYPNVPLLNEGSVAFISTETSFYVNVLQKSSKLTSKFYVLGKKKDVTLELKTSRGTRIIAGINNAQEYNMNQKESKTINNNFELFSGYATASDNDGTFLIKLRSTSDESTQWPETIHGFIVGKQLPSIIDLSDIGKAEEYNEETPVWLIVVIIIALIIVFGIFIGAIVYFCIKKRNKKVRAHESNSSERDEQNIDNDATNFDDNRYAAKQMQASQYLTVTAAPNPYVSNE